MGDTDHGNSEEEIRAFNPGAVRVWREESGDLSLEGETEDGHKVSGKGIRLAGSYPLSGPDRFICFFDSDDNYLGLLRNTADLEDGTHALVEEELSRRYFLPQIVAVRRVVVGKGMISWDVDTDRGPHHFDMRDRDDVRSVGGNRLLIIDADGNRYEVPDLSLLDSRSRGILEQLL